MSKITRLAISRKLVNQKKEKKVHQIHIFIHLSADFELKIQNTHRWPTEISELFRHLGNRHLMAQQTAQR